MTDAATPSGKHVTPSGSLTPKLALYLAWGSWLVFLTIPFALFLFVVLSLGDFSDVAPHRALVINPWFWIMLVYLLLVVPLAFFWRGHMFRAYWTGETVPPGRYLFGMLAVWTALEFGGIFSLIGCLYDRALLPDLLPALLAFMFYVTTYPSGRAMVRHVGNSEDPEMYEEPR